MSTNVQRKHIQCDKLCFSEYTKSGGKKKQQPKSVHSKKISFCGKENK